MRLIEFLLFYMVIGCLSSLLFIGNKLYGAVFAASFLLTLLLVKNWRKVLIYIGFIIIGFFSVYLYFNVNLGNQGVMRIVYKDNTYMQGVINLRKVYVNGNTKKLNEGDKVYINYKFTTQPNFYNGIVGKVYIKDFKICSKDIIKEVFIFKDNFYKKTRKVIGEDNAGLIMALCLGEDKYLNNDKINNFQKLGIIHVLSVSGFHLGIVYKFFQIIFGVKVSLGICGLYTFLTGMKGSTLRSFVMIVLLKLSKKMFKSYDGVSSLCFTALILILIRPYYLFNMGFLLSFAATLGIIMFNDKIKRKLWFLNNKLEENLAITISAQVFVVPFIAFLNKNFSLGFVIGNLIIVPLYSIIVILGNILLICSSFNFMFVGVLKIINLFIISISGVEDLILKIPIHCVYLNYAEGLVILALYISYALYNRGFKKIKYYPIFLMCYLFINYYTIIPEVDIVKAKNMTAVNLKYKTQSILVCNYDIINGKDVIKFKEKFLANKVITNPKQDVVCNLRRNNYVKIGSLNVGNNEVPTVQIISGNKKITLENKFINFKEFEVLRYKMFFGKLYKIP